MIYKHVSAYLIPYKIPAMTTIVNVAHLFYMDDLMQDCGISIDEAMEIAHSCPKPSTV